MPGICAMLQADLKNPIEVEATNAKNVQNEFTMLKLELIALMKPPHPWRSSGTSSGQDEARDHRWTKGDTKLTVQQRGIKFRKSNKVLDEVNFLTYMLINFLHRTHCSE